MNQRLMKWLLPLLILVLAVLAFRWLSSSAPERKLPQSSEKVWLVALTEVQPRRLSPQLRLYGVVEPADHARITAPAAGEVQEVLVQAGDLAVSGQTLLRMNPADFEPVLRQRQADVEDIEAQLKDLRIRETSDRRALIEETKLLDLARADLQRVEKLQRNRLSSDSAISQAREQLGRQQLSVIARKQALDRLTATRDQLQARLKRARAQLELAQLNLQRSAATAPREVRIEELPVAAGDRVRGGDLLLSWYDPESVEIRARLPLRYQDELMQALEKGEPLSARAGDLGLKLVRLAGKADPGGIDAWLSVDQSGDALRPGQQLELLLQRPPREDAIAVPASAVYDERRVFRSDEGRMHSVEVKPVGFFIDEQGKRWRLIVSNELKAGDRVVVTHLPNASEGLKIEAADAEKE